MNKITYFLSACLVILILLCTYFQWFTVPELSHKPLTRNSASNRSLLGKLPDTVLDLFVYQTVEKLLLESYQSLMVNMKKFDTVLNKDEQNTLKTYASLSMLSETEMNQEVDYLPDHTIERLDFLMTDIRRIHHKTQKMKERLDFQSICSQMLIQPIEKKNLMKIEQHNLFVYFTGRILQICPQKIQWQPHPDTSHSVINILYHALENPLFNNLHSYLENFNNKPFMRTENIFIGLYVKYLELAFEALHTNMVIRELLHGRPDLIKKYPELEYLENAMYIRRIYKITQLMIKKDE